MASAESAPENPSVASVRTPGGMSSPRIQVSHPTNLRMPPRSPSRESVATEMSLSSSHLSECGWSAGKLAAQLGFLKSVPENQQLSAYLTPQRGPSPVPGSGRFLRVPGAPAPGARSADGACCWEDETDLGVIKSCAALSKALGIQKSFSTGDIVSLDDSGAPVHQTGEPTFPYNNRAAPGSRPASNSASLTHFVNKK